MKRLFTLCLLLVACGTAFAKELNRPGLVVGIVVDQMRWDYLYRYYNHYGSDGFRRLMSSGFRCEQTFINYLPAYTAPGHACIYTGSVPAIHGITGNDWFEGGKPSYCTDDKSVMPVGGSRRWGRMSPRNLLTTTVTDELRLATNFRSRVYGISLKDRSSILPAGHLANGAYWFDDSTGTFSTSTYYRPSLPQWVAAFNARHLADTIMSKDWNLYDDPSSYTQSTADTNRYEGKFSKEEPGTGFPHSAKYFFGKGSTRYNNLRKLPAGNWLTFQLARQCIAANGLGRGPDPDFLCVSLASTDYAGHQYGPNALELEDMYIRLDREIARFLAYLDKQVGEGAYTVFLTADHGTAHNSLFLNDLDIPAGNVYESILRRELNAYLKAETGVDSAVVSLENYQVYFNASPGGGPYPYGSMKGRAMNWLKARPEVAYVLDLEEPRNTGLVPEPVSTMAANGYYAPRCGALEIVLKPGYYGGYLPTGTTHGSWNPYDTHIPLLWYGWGIPKGATNREVHMTDIAATLSALLHIQMPNGCVGKVITEIIP